MGIGAWHLYSWPKVDWRVPLETDAWPEFVHVQTTVRSDPDETQADLRHGDTVWVATVGSKLLGLGWDWIELRRGVIVLRDPNYIVSNINSLDAACYVESELRAIVSVNRIAHRVPWQSTVVKVLAADWVAAAAGPNEVLAPLLAAGRHKQRAGDGRAGRAAA